MQINRLFEIVYLLLERKTMTAPQLAQRFEVSVRTILRDIETLSMAGIPIYTVQGKGGGVRLMEGFVLSRSVLTDKEQQNILSALQGLRAIEVPQVESILSKLGALFNKSATSWIDIDFSPWDSSEREQEKFSILRDAILEKKLVVFDYYSYYGEKSHREVEPLQIVFKEKAWYLLAFCKSREDYRTFKLWRIKNLAVTDLVFLERELRPLTGTIAPEKLCTVTLKMEAAFYQHISGEWDEQTAAENPDGTFTVSITIPDDEWGYSVLLAYSEHAQVLAPEHIRQLIKDKLTAAVKKYL